MKISKKRTVQVMVFALALLLVFALAIGVSSAFYQAKRQASGTVIMDQGIIIDYKGFAENATATTWGKGVNLLLFETTDAEPGQN